MNTQPLDPQAVAMSKAIIQHESGGNFNAKGASGENGSAQWMPATWSAQAKQVLGDSNAQMTPANQKAVLYSIIKQDKDSGLNPAQIAAKWNSGQPDGWENKIGTNSMGVKYNVPAYVKSVTDLYHQYKPANPTGTNIAEASDGTTPPQQASPSVGGFLENAVSSVGNVLGGLGNAIAHPIDTVSNLVQTGAGAVENTLNMTGATKYDNPQTQMASQVGDFYAKRYGGSTPQEVAQNILKTAYNDPAGVALDISTLLSGAGGAIGAVAKAGDVADIAKAGDLANVAKVGEVTPTLSTAGKVAQGLSKAGDIINPINQGANIAGKIVGGVGKVAGEALGVGTGAGFGSIKEGLNATTKGGDASKAFYDGLRGNTTPEDIVTQAKGALDDVIQKRTDSYKTDLSKIAGDTKAYDISPIIKELQDQMTKFNINEKASGELDFSRSTLRFNKPAQADVNTIYNEMKNFGTQQGDRTAVGIDSLKRAFGDLYTPSSEARAFVQAVKSKTRNVLSQVPGYDKLSSDFANSTETINDVRKGLSLGDKAMVETSFKKLVSALRQNNEYRKAFVQDLDNATGGQLLPKIAGQQLNSVLPRGLAKYGAEAGGIIQLAHGLSLPLLFSMVSTSPRLVGEFIGALGLTKKATASLVKIIDSKVPTAKLSAILNVGKDVNQPLASDQSI